MIKRINLFKILAISAIFFLNFCAEEKKGDDSTLAALLLLSGSGGSNTVALPEKKMFLTSTQYSGNLGGVTGADEKCNSDSRKPSGSSSFKAYIFNGSTRSVERSGSTYILTDYPIAANTVYVRLDGEIIGATGSNRAFSESIDNFFISNNANLTDTRTEFWVGLMSAGSSSSTAEVRNTCSEWTSNSILSNGGYGITGDSGSKGIYFFNNESRVCNVNRPLLCIEQ
ncbi:DUF1554 domain-containing protein [Leptospira sp. GIMC2001]|uniref:DUF1554 domain-containing protein n=1 Tax=Leptospira sp. GIMC2001 TaxID=1513297 RepID=UPI00234ACA14|nr:DUF1554 domain-containing protein [Leptospira sp. GIMC2001]WCL50622.1 DUF1554 domain-containing protein [Leptospira sp. GIMC2001]